MCDSGRERNRKVTVARRVRRLLASSLGMQVIRARCSELATEYTFGVVRHLFESNVVRAEPRDRAVLLQGPAALASPVFGDGQAADEFSVMHGLYWLTVNLVERRPTTILIDDLTWADECSLRFLVYLAERLDDLPVALIVTVRSGDSAVRVAAGQPSVGVRHVADNPTGSTHRERRRSATARRPSRARRQRVACQTVLDQTGGNPFYVVSVADAIRTGEDPCLTTPESIRRRVTRRLARVDQTARALMNAGSVLGDDATLRDAVHVAGLEPEQGPVAAGELVREELLTSSDPMTFAHRIVRTAVYSLLTPAQRLRTARGRLGDWQQTVLNRRSSLNICCCQDRPVRIGPSRRSMPRVARRREKCIRQRITVSAVRRRACRTREVTPGAVR